MKKNNQPYSEPSSVQLAFVDDLASFCTVRNLFLSDFKPHMNWYDIPEVSGSLQPSIVADKQGSSTLYNVSVKFRVAYATPENQSELDKFVHSGLILKYRKGGGKIAILGTKANPLQFTFSSSDTFDGFECELKGSQTTPECYSM